MNILIRKLFLCVVYIVRGETHYAHLDDLYMISRCFIDRFEHQKLAEKKWAPQIAGDSSRDLLIP